MKKTKDLFLTLNLQLFAEGGAAAGDGGTAAGETGVSAAAAVQQKMGAKNPLASVVYGKQEGAQVADAQQAQQPEAQPPVDRNAEFDKLINGEYKDLYNARVQDTIQKRLKSTKETVDKYEALQPVLSMLGDKYGVDATNVESLMKALSDDDSFFEEEALERGISVEQLKQIKRMERENEELKRQMQEERNKERADALYQSWLTQSEQIKGIYPNFDLNAEIQNPTFQQLLRNNVDVRTAYEVVHKDEIIPEAMRFAAKNAEQKVANNIKANGQRATENGVSSNSPATHKSDVSSLTAEDLHEIQRRVARGERITFG